MRRAAGAATPRDACARRRPARPRSGSLKARGARAATWGARCKLGGAAGQLPAGSSRPRRGALPAGPGSDAAFAEGKSNAVAAVEARARRREPPTGHGGASEPGNGPRSAGPAAAFGERDKAPRRRPRHPLPAWALLSPPVRRRRAAGLSAFRGGRSGGCLFVRSACWLPPVTRGDAQFPELSGSGRRDRHRHEHESPPLAPAPPCPRVEGGGGAVAVPAVTALGAAERRRGSKFNLRPGPSGLVAAGGGEERRQGKEAGAPGRSNGERRRRGSARRLRSLRWGGR